MRTRRKGVNKLKIIIAVLVFIAIVFGGSALLTRKPENKANVAIGAESNVGEQAKVENTNKTEEALEESLVKMQNQLEENKEIKEQTKEPEQEKSKQEEQTKEESKEEAPKKEKVVNTNNPVKSGRLPVANENAVALCKQAQSAHEKNIYLTFDDGPSPNITPQVLSILKEYNVPATFFVLGSRVELYPELVRQEYEAGHYIANHGYSHTYSSIYSSVQSVLDEYDQCETAIQNALGLREFHSYLFRFPGGSSGGPYDSLKNKLNLL